MRKQQEDLELRILYRNLVEQWQDMAEQAEHLEKMAREFEAEMEKLEPTQRRSGARHRGKPADTGG